MDSMLMENKVLNLEKSIWQLTKLGDLANEISKRVDNPAESEYDRFVGLENFVSGDIKIRSWKCTDGLASSAKAFKAGDILFARRNAYLRRASLVDFEGCCSGDAFVLRENHEKVVPGFLAFLLNSNAVWDYANSNAAGTMSKRVKWRDLAEYKFLLPPKDQQTQLAELLWAMDKVIESEINLEQILYSGFKVFRKSFIHTGSNQTDETQKLRFGFISSKWTKGRISEFCQIISGNAFKSEKFKSSGDTQVLRIGNLTDQGFDFSKSPVFIDGFASSERKYLIPAGAVVLSLTGTNGKRDYGYPSLMRDNNQFLLNQRLSMLIPDEKVMTSEFLYLLSKMEIFQAPFFLNATGTANQANVSTRDIGNIYLPIPSLEEQNMIVNRLNYFRKGIDHVQKIIQDSRILQKRLINQIF